MNVTEIATRKELLDIAKKLERIEAELRRINPSDRVIRSKEIMERMGLKSRMVFMRRVPELRKYGMYKDGKAYAMRLYDFLNFLKAQKEEHENS